MVPNLTWPVLIKLRFTCLYSRPLSGCVAWSRLSRAQVLGINVYVEGELFIVRSLDGFLSMLCFFFLFSKLFRSPHPSVTSALHKQIWEYDYCIVFLGCCSRSLISSVQPQQQTLFICTINWGFPACKSVEQRGLVSQAVTFCISGWRFPICLGDALPVTSKTFFYVHSHE